MYIILTDAEISEASGCSRVSCKGNYELAIHSYGKRIDIKTMADEIKLEAFLAGMANKTQEEIESFFK